MCLCPCVSLWQHHDYGLKVMFRDLPIPGSHPFAQRAPLSPALLRPVPRQVCSSSAPRGRSWGGAPDAGRQGVDAFDDDHPRLGHLHLAKSCPSAGLEVIDGGLQHAI